MGWPLTTKEYGGAWIYGRQRQRRLARLRHRARLCRPAARSAARAAGVQAASVCGEAARRRQDDPLRREVDALRRLVGDSAGRGQWMDDPRRLCRLPEFGAAQGNSSGDQERHARGRDCIRSAEERRFVGRDAGRVPEESRIELDQRRTLESAQPASGIRARNVCAACSTLGCR